MFIPFKMELPDLLSAFYFSNYHFRNFYSFHFTFSGPFCKPHLPGLNHPMNSLRTVGVSLQKFILRLKIIHGVISLIPIRADANKQSRFLAFKNIPHLCVKEIKIGFDQVQQTYFKA